MLWGDKSNHYRNAGCVLDIIVSESPDIFLQEFDVTSDVSIKFFKRYDIFRYASTVFFFTDNLVSFFFFYVKDVVNCIFFIFHSI